MNLDDIFELENKHILKYYRKKNLCIVKGYMQYVWDIHGVKYLDCNTCYGAAFLGHRNDKIVNAIIEQLNKITLVPMTFYNDTRAMFIKKLRRLLPSKFTGIVIQNSGTEAVEVALKIARKFTRKRKFLAFINSFHGRTFGSLSITGNERYRKPFEPLLPEVIFAKFNVVHELNKLINEDLAAVIVEPIQGEGGINVATIEFMKELRKLTEEKGVLLILDEIQTGCGRTGYVWAFQHYGIEPDIFVIGKAIGGGLPIGITIVKNELQNVFTPGDHGSTFGGNPFVLAAASAACDVIIEDKVPEQVRLKSRKLLKEVEDLVSRSKTALRLKGMGFMIGIELRQNADDYVNKLLQEKVIALTAGINVLRLLPPYAITNNDIEHLVNSLAKILEVKS